MKVKTFRERENTELVNFRAADQTEEVQTERLLTFYVDKKLFAVPLETVLEIIEMQPVTFLPRMPSYIKGVINVRGKIVPLVEFRARFGYEPCGYNENTGIIITENDTGMVGYIIDKIGEILNVSQHDILDAPQTGASAEYADAIVRIGSDRAFKLNLAKILEQ